MFFFVRDGWTNVKDNWILGWIEIKVRSVYGFLREGWDCVGNQFGVRVEGQIDVEI